jgi:hypothetical protein
MIEHWLEEDQDLGRVGDRKMFETIGETPKLSDRCVAAGDESGKCGLGGRGGIHFPYPS